MAEDLKACRTYCPVMQLESAGSLCHEGNSWELALLTQGTRDAVAAAQTGKVSAEPPPHAGSAPSPSQGGVCFPAGHRAGHRQYTASTALGPPGLQSPAEPLVCDSRHRKALLELEPGNCCNENSLTQKHRHPGGFAPPSPHAVTPSTSGA